MTDSSGDGGGGGGGGGGGEGGGHTFVMRYLRMISVYYFFIIRDPGTGLGGSAEELHVRLFSLFLFARL